VNFKIARKYLTLTLLLALLLSSHTARTPSPDVKTNVVRALPPTFITIADIKDCDPSGVFPQANPLPFYTQATQVQFSCNFYEKDYVAWTMYIFYELWEKEFGDPDNKVKEALDHLQIKWSEESKEVHNVYDIHGNFLEVATVSGLMEGPYGVWIKVAEDISDTSFVHELVHIALFHTCGSADPDHEGDKYLCWTDQHSLFIDKVDNKLKTKYGL
jgi:hypothetical protein